MARLPRPEAVLYVSLTLSDVLNTIRHTFPPGINKMNSSIEQDAKKRLVLLKSHEEVSNDDFVDIEMRK